MQPGWDGGVGPEWGRVACQADDAGRGVLPKSLAWAPPSGPCLLDAGPSLHVRYSGPCPLAPRAVVARA